MKKSFKLSLIEGLKKIAQLVRPLLGPLGACIYPVNCLDYAESALLSKRLPIALVCIVGRILSCNPLGALVRYMRHKR